ncbi:MAG: protein-L-isoaspartate(D-aspartate) O-methyltransferase [Candidatus Omnitrophota bacterium]|nr:protein-L-isoaspartate(D-aspartate) O-methyltransferase [Candidatus Omnitrophota bacterium]
MDFQRLRERMVAEQLSSRGIRDERVLKAMLKVPRHEFISNEHQDSAYADYPLAIGEGQTISQPYIVALMTEALQLKGEEKVLEIGAGSGYQAAILAELVQEVYSVERIKSLADNTTALLKKMGYGNINIKVADGTLGWEEFAPFDRIIVTAASPQVPDTLIKQLKENGILVIPLAGSFAQMLTRITKEKSGLKSEDICACVFVPLVGKYGYKEQ